MNIMKKSYKLIQDGARVACKYGSRGVVQAKNDKKLYHLRILFYHHLSKFLSNKCEVQTNDHHEKKSDKLLQDGARVTSKYG